jgi:flagellar basal body rod protein FlgG
VKAKAATMCAANAEEKMAMQMQERSCVQYSEECTLMTAVQKMFQRNFGLNP